jgi:hypothetical protein
MTALGLVQWSPAAAQLLIAAALTAAAPQMFMFLSAQQRLVLLQQQHALRMQHIWPVVIRLWQLLLLLLL